MQRRPAAFQQPRVILAVALPGLDVLPQIGVEASVRVLTHQFVQIILVVQRSMQQRLGGLGLTTGARDTKAAPYANISRC